MVYGVSSHGVTIDRQLRHHCAAEIGSEYRTIAACLPLALGGLHLSSSRFYFCCESDRTLACRGCSVRQWAPQCKPVFVQTVQGLCAECTQGTRRLLSIYVADTGTVRSSHGTAAPASASSDRSDWWGARTSFQPFPQHQTVPGLAPGSPGGPALPQRLQMRFCWQIPWRAMTDFSAPPGLAQRRCALSECRGRRGAASLLLSPPERNLRILQPSPALPQLHSASYAPLSYFIQFFFAPFCVAVPCR